MISEAVKCVREVITDKTNKEMEKTTLTAEEVWSQHVEDAEQYGTPRKQIIHAMEEYASLLTKEKDREIEMWKDYYAGASMLVEELQSKLTRLKEEIEVINIANIMSAEILNEQEAKLTRLKEQADRMAEALKDIMNYTSEGRSYNTAESALKEYRK